MDFVQRTIDLARHNVAEGGRPFATVIVKDGDILAESANKVNPGTPRSRSTACGRSTTAANGASPTPLPPDPRRPPERLR